MIVRYGDRVLFSTSNISLADASRVGAPILLTALFAVVSLAVAVALPAPQTAPIEAAVVTDARPALPQACAGETWPNYSEGCVSALRAKAR